MRATAKDLRFHSKEILETVSRGEEVIITYRGKPQAKIIPFGSDSGLAEENNQLFGIWKDNKSVDNVDNYISEQRKRRL